jgi:hypothetical protein
VKIKCNFEIKIRRYYRKRDCFCLFVVFEILNLKEEERIMCQREIGERFFKDFQLI